MLSGYHIEPDCTYLGFKYYGEKEREEDCYKIYHTIVWPCGKQTFGPWSSYVFPSSRGG